MIPVVDQVITSVSQARKLEKMGISYRRILLWNPSDCDGTEKVTSQVEHPFVTVSFDI